MCPYYLDGDLGPIFMPRAEARGRPIRPVIPVATRAYRVRVAVATVQFSKAAERATRASAGTVAGDGRRGLSKLNSMRGLELGGMPRGASRPPPARETLDSEPRSLAERDDSWPGQVRSTC
jgi:hypothetical protein